MPQPGVMGGGEGRTKARQAARTCSAHDTGMVKRRLHCCSPKRSARSGPPAALAAALAGGHLPSRLRLRKLLPCGCCLRLAQPLVQAAQVQRARPLAVAPFPQQRRQPGVQPLGNAVQPLLLVCRQHRLPLAGRLASCRRRCLLLRGWLPPCHLLAAGRPRLRPRCLQAAPLAAEEHAWSRSGGAAAELWAGSRGGPHL